MSAYLFFNMFSQKVATVRLNILGALEQFGHILFLMSVIALWESYLYYAGEPVTLIAGCLFTVSASDCLFILLAAMETDAEKPKEEAAADDSAATAVSKGDASQVQN